MAASINPFAQQIQHAFLSYLIPGLIISGLIRLFRKELENWIVAKLRALFGRAPAPQSQEHEDLALDAPPACPSCRKPMVPRMRKLGMKKDSSFWGCSSFPSCRGTRSITAVDLSAN